MTSNKDLTKAFFLCLGTNAEASPFIIESFKYGYNVLALGLNTKECIESLNERAQSLNLSVKVFTLTLEQALDSNSYQKLIKLINPAYSNVVFVNLDIKNIDSIVKLSKLYNVKGILPNPIGALVKNVGILNDLLNLQGPDEAIAKLSGDKLLFSQKQEQFNCNLPPYVYLNESSFKEDIEANCTAYTQKDLVRDFTKEHPFPLILKPRFGSGSNYISVCFNQEELDCALAQIKSLIDNKENNHDCFCYDMLLSNFIEHQKEFSGLAIVAQGQIVAIVFLDKIKITNLPYRQEISYSSIQLPANKRQVLYQEFAKNIAALNVKNAIINADILFNEQEYKLDAYVVDMSVRHSGYGTYDLYNLLGIRLTDYFLEYAIGGKSLPSEKELSQIQQEIDNKFERQSVFMSFFSLKEGTLKSLPDYNNIIDCIQHHTNEDRALAKEHLICFTLNLQEGQKLFLEDVTTGKVTTLGKICFKNLTNQQVLNIMTDINQYFTY